MAPLPKFAPSKVRQVVNAECRPYTELSSAYATHSAERLRKCIEQQGATYTTVRMAGLRQGAF